MTRCRLLALALLLLPGGCESVKNVGRAAWPETDRLTEVELSNRIVDFADGFSGSVQDASSRIIDLVDDRQIRRRAVFWKITAINDCRRASLIDDPQRAFNELLALTMQLRVFFESGDPQRATAAPLLGAGQPIAAETMRGLELRLREDGPDFFIKTNLQPNFDEVESFVRAHPMTGMFVRDSYMTGASPEQKRALQRALEVPLKPFKIFDGIDQGAHAAAELAQTADRFTSVVQETPERIRWQLELLSYELENLESLQRALDGMDSVAQSADRLAATSEALPGELRATLDQAADRLVEQSAEVEQLLASSRTTLSELEQAGAAWQGTFEALRDITGKRDDKPDAQPAAEGEESGFNVTEYGDAAREIAAAGQELRLGIEELNRLLASDRLQDSTAEAVDHLAWRLGQLALFVFGLVAIHRLTLGRRRN